MKIERVDENKIKVILNFSELSEFNIKSDNILPESPEMNGFIKEVLKAVGKETGVFIEEGRILIETDRINSEIIILIIKIAADSLNVKRQKAHQKLDRLIFEIANLDEVLSMLFVLSENIIKRMRLYKYNDKYYISLPRFPLPVEIWEFSKKCRRCKVGEAVLSEHGMLIACEEDIIKIAKEIKK